MLCVIMAGCSSNHAAKSGSTAKKVNAKSAYDSRRVTKIFKDDELAHHLRNEYKQMVEFKDSEIRVVVFDKVLLILGQTPTATQRKLIHNVAVDYAKNRRVVNRMSVEGPISTITHTSDAWITTKIKAQLISGYFFKAGQFKVTTENGVVYLLGNVSTKESALATKLSRETTGVRRVVTLFEHHK